jgi:hypothetical protein
VALVAAAAWYVLADWATIERAQANSFVSTLWAYGHAVLFEGWRRFPDAIGWGPAPPIWAGSLTLVLLAGLAFQIGRAARPAAPETAALFGFVLGAAIQVGVYAATVSFVYRQIFMLLCVPWLWQRAAAGSRRCGATLGLIAAVFWLPAWAVGLRGANFLVDAALFALLLAELVAVVPVLQLGPDQPRRQRP